MHSVTESASADNKPRQDRLRLLPAAVLLEDRRPNGALVLIGTFASLTGPYVRWSSERIFVNFLGVTKNRDGELIVGTSQC